MSTNSDETHCAFDLLVGHEAVEIWQRGRHFVVGSDNGEAAIGLHPSLREVFAPPWPAISQGWD